MPKTAKQILAEQGYNDTDAAVILNDAKFVRAIEAADAAAEARANAFQTELEQAKQTLKRTEDWYNTQAVPTIEKTNREAVAARSRVAQLEAQLKAEAELGLRRVAEQDNTQATQQTQQTQQTNAAGEIDSRYVTSETFQRTADQFGTALAMAADIPFEHQELFGKRLPGGVEGLRAGYQKARTTGFQGNMRDYWAQEYKVSDRRTEIEKEARQKEIDTARAEERRQVMSEMVNPNTRAPQGSRNPFAGKKIEGGTVDGKQPWERGTPEQRRSARVIRFGTQVLNDVNSRTT